jgi:hypothetical protein
METPGWIREMFKVIDARDVDGFVKFLTPEGMCRFGNAPALQGREAIHGGVSGFFKMLGGISHELINVWGGPESYAIQLEVTYTRLDGSRLTTPGCVILYMEGHLIKQYLINGDLSPLFNPPSQ